VVQVLLVRAIRAVVDQRVPRKTPRVARVVRVLISIVHMAAVGVRVVVRHGQRTLLQRKREAREVTMVAAVVVADIRAAHQARSQARVVVVV
jgi:hypothetical protein